MKQLLVLLLSLCAAVFTAYSQDNPGTQNITLGACGACNSYAGNVNTATASAIPACSGIADDDLFYTFVAPAPTVPGDLVGIKVTVTTSAFDVVVQLITNANANVKCVNDVVGIGGEELIHYGLITGQTYHIRVHSVNDVPGAGNFNVCFEQIPELFLRPQYLNFGPSGNGYSINEIISREFFASPGPVQKTGWKLVCVASGEEFFREVNGISTQVNLNTITGICYNKTYKVYCRVMIAGIWCGYGSASTIIMESEPNTSILAASCGQTYDIYQSVMSVAYLNASQIIGWEFSTDNGNTVFTALSLPGSSIIELSNVPQMRYNKIYNVRVRAQICGQWGPYGGGCFMITGPLPYTYAEAQYCNVVLGVGGNMICEFVQNATNYIWQFAPIQCGDPTFTPIGAAQLINSPDPIINLGEITVVPGACYRVGVKPFVGEQQGDYGQFCQIQIAGGFAPPEGQEIYAGEQRANIKFPDANETMLYPNPNQGSFNLIIDSKFEEEQISLDIYNSAGVLVYTEIVMPDFDALRKLELNLGLSPGFYSMRLSSANHAESKHFLVQ